MTLKVGNKSKHTQAREPMRRRSFPDWLDLITCWLTTHHQGHVCVVVSHPLDQWDNWEKVMKKFTPSSETQVRGINAEHCILQCKSLEAAQKIVNSIEAGTGPRCYVWDKDSIVHEN